MIENLIHTAGKDVKTAHQSAIHAAYAKGESKLEGEFKALFQSFNAVAEKGEEAGSGVDTGADIESNSDSNSNVAMDHQEHMDESIENESNMDRANADLNKRFGSSEIVQSIDKQGNRGQDITVESHEKNANGSLGKNTIENELNPVDSKVDNVLNQTNLADLSSDDRVGSEFDTEDNSDQNNNYLESEFEQSDNLDLKDWNVEPSETVISDQNEKNHSLKLNESINKEVEIPENDQVRRIDSSKTADLLSGAEPNKVDPGSDTPELNDRSKSSDENAGSKVDPINESPINNGATESVRNGNGGLNRAIQNEIPVNEQNVKYAPELSRSNLSETDLKEQGRTDLNSNQINRDSRAAGVHTTELRSDVSNLTDDQIRIPSGKGLGPDQGKTNEKDSEIRRAEGMPPVSQDGNDIQKTVQIMGQETDRAQTDSQEPVRVQAEGKGFANIQSANGINDGTITNQGIARQNTEESGVLRDRFENIDENIKKPIQSSQKPVESSVLMQDKVQPKRERNDLSFMNGEVKEDSRLVIPGTETGTLSKNQNIPFKNSHFSDEFGSFSKSNESEILWKEHTTESTESQELNRSELSAAALSKLGDSTLSNHFLRRVLLPGLTQTVQTASGQSDRAENWQRHNFILEDGSKVQLSARKVDGVLQIKLGASLGELSKLLQVHQDEIREHLEKECNIQIDLQFDDGSDHHEESSLENFFGDSTEKSSVSGGIDTGSNANRGVKKQLHNVAARNFGYNSKEWTA